MRIFMFHIIELEKGEACHKVKSNNRREENQMWGRGERGNERGETANEMSFLSLFFCEVIIRVCNHCMYFSLMYGVNVELNLSFLCLTRYIIKIP